MPLPLAEAHFAQGRVLAAARTESPRQIYGKRCAASQRGADDEIPGVSGDRSAHLTPTRPAERNVGPAPVARAALGLTVTQQVHSHFLELPRDTGFREGDYAGVQLAGQSQQRYGHRSAAPLSEAHAEGEQGPGLHG